MSGNVGIVRQVMGPVVDVEFTNGKLPQLNNALKLTNKSISDEEGNLIVEVALTLVITWLEQLQWMQQKV
jgi:F-type H+-transporting ATPase subunit beta